MSELVDELRSAEELILSVTDRSDWKSIAEYFRKAADRIHDLESRELGYIQSLRELEARVRELENRLLRIKNNYPLSPWIAEMIDGTD